MDVILKRMEDLIDMIRGYDFNDNIVLRDEKILLLYQEVVNLKEFTIN